MIFAYIFLFMFFAFNAVTAIVALTGLGFVIAQSKRQTINYGAVFMSWWAFIGGTVALSLSWGLGSLASVVFPNSDAVIWLWIGGYAFGITLGLLVGAIKGSRTRTDIPLQSVRRSDQDKFVGLTH